MGYIKNLQFGKEEPKVQPWGDGYSHVPLNVRTETVTDENGKTEEHHTADVVEKVANPVSVQNIVKAAAEAEFGTGIADYVAANIYNSDDEKVKAYTEFAKKVSADAKAMGYK